MPAAIANLAEEIQLRSKRYTSIMQINLHVLDLIGFDLHVELALSAAVEAVVVNDHIMAVFQLDHVGFIVLFRVWMREGG